MVVVSSPDVDGGWSVIVLICVCLARVLIYGISYSAAILYYTFLEDFQESPTLTSWAVNTTVVVCFVFNQVGNVLSRLVGIRTTITIGCLLSSVGILATSFVPSVRWLFLTHGLVTGIGFSLANITQYSALTQYFVKNRKIAISLHAASITLGQFVYSPLIFLLFERFHWRGAFIILSALNLNMLLFAAAAIKPRRYVEDAKALERLTVTIEDNGNQNPNTTASRSQLSQLLDDLRLLRNVHFLLMVMSNLLFSVGLSAFLTHIVSYSKGLGHSEVEAAFLPSIMAIASLVSRASIGAILQLLKLSVPLPLIITFTTAGILMSIFGLVQNYIALTITTASISFLIGMCAMYPEFAILLVGVDKLPTAVSILSIAGALGFFIGGPTTALLYEIDPSYRTSFVVVGIATSIGGLINLPTVVKVDDKRLIIINAFDD